MTEEKKQYERMGVRRYPVSTERICPLVTISCENLRRSERLARIIDLSVLGIGIEIDQPIQRELVWLKNSVFGQKFGIVVWCRQIGAVYRAGIRFVPLAGPEEEYLRKQIALPKQYDSIEDPDRIIATLVRKITKE
jgi:hypothetical protein